MSLRDSGPDRPFLRPGEVLGPGARDAEGSSTFWAGVLLGVGRTAPSSAPPLSVLVLLSTPAGWGSLLFPTAFLLAAGLAGEVVVEEN